MGAQITNTQIERYESEGWCAPIGVLNSDEVAHCRDGLERYENSVGHPIEFPEKY